MLAAVHPRASGGPTGPVAVSRCGPRTWPRRPGSGWKRYLTRARGRGGSTCWPARSRSRSARSPLPGTTGSPRPGSESGRLARRAGPAAPVGPRSLAGTGRRMRRRSGSCWTASTRRAAAGAPASNPRPACAATVPGEPRSGKSAGPRPVNGRRRGRQDPAGPGGRRYPGPSPRRRRTRRAPPGPPRRALACD